MEIWIIWLSLIIILAIIELVTQWLTTFCLAVGSIGALIVNISGGSLTMQLIMLGVVALLTLVVAGPKFKKRYVRQGKIASKQSNMDALRGRKALVVKLIDGENIPGRVKIDGDCWQAVAEDDNCYEVGQIVEVVDYDSIVLIVK